jgi:hypothetical protein
MKPPLRILPTPAPDPSPPCKACGLWPMDEAYGCCRACILLLTDPRLVRAPLRRAA